MLPCFLYGQWTALSGCAQDLLAREPPRADPPLRKADLQGAAKLLEGCRERI